MDGVFADDVHDDSCVACVADLHNLLVGNVLLDFGNDFDYCMVCFYFVDEVFDSLDFVKWFDFDSFGFDNFDFAYLDSFFAVHCNFILVYCNSDIVGCWLGFVDYDIEFDDVD